MILENNSNKKSQRKGNKKLSKLDYVYLNVWKHQVSKVSWDQMMLMSIWDLKKTNEEEELVSILEDEFYYWNQVKIRCPWVKTEHFIT